MTREGATNLALRNARSWIGRHSGPRIERGDAGDDPLRAVLWVTLSMALLAVIAALVRYAALGGVPSSVSFFWRNLFAVLWMLPLLWVRGASLATTAQPRLYILRVVLSFVSMSAFFHALSLIPIGDATAISFLSPLFGTLFAIVLLGEIVGWRRWMALAAGFAGALIILRPWSGAAIGFGEGQLAALLSALCVGLIGPLVKQLTNADDPDRIVFITSLLMTPASLIPALWFWVWPTAEQWLVLAALGLAAVLGHMTLVRGYTAAEASLVMTFKFSRLPFAVALGYVAFGETTDAATWLGALVIFAAGVFVTRREARLAKERKASRGSLLPPPGNV